MKLFTIGEFSRITGLSVKTLRFYHDEGVLQPTRIDGRSGYRYYAENKIDTARAIRRLRELEFSLAEITEILRQYEEEGDVLDHLERHREFVSSKLASYRKISTTLEQMIQSEREARQTMSQESSQFEIEKKSLEPMLIAGIRMTGRYSDCGKAFGKIGRTFGRHLCGKPMLLHFSEGYREDDADFEACIPVRQAGDRKGITVRELPGGSVLSLTHRGSYEEIGRSYEKIIARLRDEGLEYELPSREIYIKGPGMIFRGNPAKYLTEIQFPLK